jgi:hypothetical protein
MAKAGAHKLVAETAMAMAHELYDTLMSDNLWYEAWTAQNPGLGPKALEARFCAKNQQRLLPGARATLAGLLREPIDPGQKEVIMEALLLDATLRVGRGGRWVRASDVLGKEGH